MILLATADIAMFACGIGRRRTGEATAPKRLVWPNVPGDGSYAHDPEGLRGPQLMRPVG